MFIRLGFFASLKSRRCDIALVGTMFALVTALWCMSAHWLVCQPTLGASIPRYDPESYDCLRTDCPD
jgi:hypothetical protein